MTESEHADDGSTERHEPAAPPASELKYSDLEARLHPDRPAVLVRTVSNDHDRVAVYRLTGLERHGLTHEKLRVAKQAVASQGFGAHSRADDVEGGANSLGGWS